MIALFAPVVISAAVEGIVDEDVVRRLIEHAGGQQDGREQAQYQGTRPENRGRRHIQQLCEPHTHGQHDVEGGRLRVQKKERITRAVEQQGPVDTH